MSGPLPETDALMELRIRNCQGFSLITCPLDLLVLSPAHTTRLAPRPLAALPLYTSSSGVRGRGQGNRTGRSGPTTPSTYLYTCQAPRATPHLCVGQVSFALSWGAVSLSPHHLSTGHHDLSTGMLGPDHLGSNPALLQDGCGTVFISGEFGSSLCFYF